MKEETIKRRRRKRIRKLWERILILVPIILVIMTTMVGLVFLTFYQSRPVSTDDAFSVSGVVQSTFYMPGGSHSKPRIYITVNDNTYYILARGLKEIDIQGKQISLLAIKKIALFRTPEIVALETDDISLRTLDETNLYRAKLFSLPGAIIIIILGILCSTPPLFGLCVSIRWYLEECKQDRVYNRKRYLRSESNADSAKKTPKPSKDKIKRT